MTFSGRWMELEKYHPHDVTQTQKDKHGLDSYVDISCYINDGHGIIQSQKGKV